MFSNILYCLFKENNYELLVGIVQIKFSQFNSGNKAHSNLAKRQHEHTQLG